MSRGVRLWVTLVLGLALAVPFARPLPASADLEPPWCGTPEPDAAARLPDGSERGDPPGSFPHIPYYAIGCTLESIRDASDGRMKLRVVGHSARGRDLYLVTINALQTRAQRTAYARTKRLRRLALNDPERGQRLLKRWDNVKVPIFIQAGIHGDEFEGVDAALRVIERLATTPYGNDPSVDAVLDNSVVVFNVIQNPDGRIGGTRTNGNGFDLNRDYITQSQPETQASVNIFQQWLPSETLDLHGYVTPTLVDGTTVPHNPSIEYDIFLKWNQPRLDANQVALAAKGFAISRPANGRPPGWIPPGRNPAAGMGRLGTLLHGRLRAVDQRRRLHRGDV
jgi:hypothetical protein